AHAHGVDDDLDAVPLEDLVTFGDLVEHHAVLEPGAAASLHVDPEAALGQVRLLLLQDRLDLLGRGGREIDHELAPSPMIHLSGFERSPQSPRATPAAVSPL